MTKQRKTSKKVAKIASKLLRNKRTNKKSKTVVTLTDFMIWFFAFGLIGLGMQITKKSVTQAGGWPIVMGVIAGVTKATLSFFVVLWLVKDVVLN